MRLSKLILHGFKSFADKTEFAFDSPITGVVGPNGCGKSNVVDAVKWVLGEQSAKSLRGEAMLDVIFNGSGDRKPAGAAEVTLVFSNPAAPDGTRKLQLDTDEVSVGRRLYRDGNSAYTLNGRTSRLMDVRDLFLDTGVGVDAYSVIEQGRVSQMLESNPQQRRLIFEEAAGISRFKAKKREAQRKLERVDQNLLRVNDIVEEVEKRLRSVKVQAGRARTFKEHADRLADLRLAFALREYHLLTRRRDELSKQADGHRFSLDDATTDLQRKQDQLAGHRGRADEVSTDRQRLDHERVQTDAKVTSAQQRQRHADQQARQIDEQSAGLRHDLTAAATRRDETAASLAAESINLKDLTAKLEAARGTITGRDKSFRDGQRTANDLNQRAEACKSAILAAMRKASAVAGRLGSIDIHRTNLAGQQKRLADRRRLVLEETGQGTARRDDLKSRLDAAEKSIADRQAEHDAKRAEAASLGQHISRLTEQLGAARESRSGLRSRQKVLEDLEARREGVSEGVREVLRRREKDFPFIRGLVADALRVDVEHAATIEAALDGRDQWLVADHFDATSAAPFAKLPGRVNLLRGTGVPPASAPSSSSTEEEERGRDARATVPADRSDRGTGVPPASAASSWSTEGEERGRDARATVPADRSDRGTGVPPASAASFWFSEKEERGRDARATVPAGWVRLAVDLVRYAADDAPLVRHLLGTTAVVRTLADAIALHRTGPAGWRYVARSGEVVESDGTLRAGPFGAGMGLLSRRSELDALAAQLAAADQRIGTLSAEVASGNERAKGVERATNELRNAVHDAKTRRVEVAGQLAAAADKLAALARELPVLDRELSGLLDQSGKLKTEEATLRGQAAALDAEQSDGEAEVARLTEQQAGLAGDLKRWGDELTAARVTFGQVQEKQLGSRQAVDRQTAAVAELGQQIGRMEKSLATVGDRRAAVVSEREAAGRDEAALVEAKQSLAERLTKLAEEAEGLKRAVREGNESVESARAARTTIEKAAHETEVALSQVAAKLESAVARAADDLSLDLPAKYADSPDYEPADEDWDAVADEIKQLREKIGRLGNVNLDAIAEQEELESRATFLHAQVDDLATSKSQLVDLIDTINRESGVRFEQTFNTVREHFQAMFRKLFGGGKADVFLETEIETKGDDGQIIKQKVDVLDAGIEIVARPPGKQPATISQLSGGEKTMTCIALLMSIFKSKPSPFCILDEVDAALDEANNDRFNLIVQEFLEQSQFIVITHSKRTMRIADVLYGVTMQEPGVSKRVAVRFDQVDQEGRIKAGAEAA